MRETLLFILSLFSIQLCVSQTTSVEIEGITYNLSEADYSACVSHISYLAGIKVDENERVGSKVIVPSKIEANQNIYDVTSIKSNVCGLDNSWIRYLTLPNSIITIDEYAFSQCEYLKEVTIGTGVNQIGNNAFKNCRRIEKVFVSDLEAWCNITFGSYHSVSDIEYGRNANPLNPGTDFYLNGECIRDLIIPTTITQIKDCTFCGGSFSYIHFHSGVRNIGNASFLQLPNLKEIILPDNIISIGDYAFGNCSNVSKIVLGKNFSFAGLWALPDNNVKEFYSYNDEPPHVTWKGNYIFSYFDPAFYSATLYVPQGSLSKYQNDYVWGKFKNIDDCLETASIKDVPLNDDSKPFCIFNHTVYFYDCPQFEYCIFDMNGNLIYRGKDQTFELPYSGLFILKTKCYSFKIVK